MYRVDTGVWTPFTVATPNGSNFPDSYSSSPYGPSFGSMDGILRVAGVYKTGSSSYDLGYLYDGAAAPGSPALKLAFPDQPGEPTLFTFPHSTFGNTIVGDYDTQLDTGNAFIYDIPSGTFTTNNVPGEISTTAYGIYGDKIAGGYGAFGPGGEPGFEHGYVYDRPTDTFTTYDHPGAIVTHFEGISGAGRGDEYNLVVDWVGVDGQHAAVLHIDAQGNETWIPLEIDGATTVSANSIYGDTAIGVYTDATGVHGYTVKIPGIYNPIRNEAKLVDDAPDAVVISAGKGDDVVNDGQIRVTGAGGVGIRSETYGVVNNDGKVVATGKDGVAVDMNGEFGALLNGGVVRAAKGADAIRADGTAIGSVVVNDGVIDGRVVIKAGPHARFENSGWLGVSGPGAGVRHKISGLYAQTPDGVPRASGQGFPQRQARHPRRGAARRRRAARLPAGGGPRPELHHRHRGGADRPLRFARAVRTAGLCHGVARLLGHRGRTRPQGEASEGSRPHPQPARRRRRRRQCLQSGEDIPTEVNAALFGLTEDRLPQALDMHSGEIFASVQSVLINQGLFVREALLGRLRQPTAAAPGADLALGYAAAAGASPTAAVFAPDPSLWVQGIGAWGEHRRRRQRLRRRPRTLAASSAASTSA